ncbi:MAG TPA: hypothetical protein VEX63_02855, partial [Flavisolibacter sp.]|nr:hypothetical protein [Flavisolibacter sp.]
MKLLRCILLCFLFTNALTVFAQTPLSKPISNLRIRTLPVSGDSLQLDTLSIVPNSFYLHGLPDSLFRLDVINAILYWNQQPETDSITVTYRVFPYRLNQVAQRMNYDSIARFTYMRPFEFNAGEKESKSLFNFGTVEYTGSFGRGISFGNNQDAVVTSNFQLQLNGMLGDSIEIAAAITDNNIPIQP